MRKTIITGNPAGKTEEKTEWLNLDAIASVEVTSEDPGFPIEDALGAAASAGWRAATTGPQVIRLVFDAPQTIHKIHLHFMEREAERSQEFSLHASDAHGTRELLRQQWSFSPGGSTEETEEYTADLKGISALELKIDPDRSHDPKLSRHHATLRSLKLA